MNTKILMWIMIFADLDITSSQSKIQNEFELPTDKLMQDSCSFLSTGRNAFFILEPGYQLILEGKNNSQLIITVLNETKTISNVETRVVEEHETINGKPIEISRNFYAFCKQTGSIYYFGEEVDIYKNEKIASHEGSWIAEGKYKPGIIMPGIVLLGAKYYQEMAPGIAMDMAEIISVSETIKTHAGYFVDCLKTEETNELKPKEKEYKYYAPGVGLIKDEELLLLKHGFIK